MLATRGLNLSKNKNKKCYVEGRVSAVSYRLLKVS